MVKIIIPQIRGFLNFDKNVKIENMNYQSVVGLELHIELKTKTKMFCDCKNDPDERHPNVNVCPICMGHPGVLPVINKEAVRKTIKTGLALNCGIPEISKFDRKNYFYPDLPKNYQISQLYQPLCRGGFLAINGKRIRIREVHLEEDTGRLIHPEGSNYSLVDFNRAGIPLMELATEPDITSAKEARKFAEELQLILRYLDVSEADMEKGEFRVEANISLTTDIKKLGTKVEIKNLNSFRAAEGAIEYEIQRQAELLDRGEKITQETRGWDGVKRITVSQREKEEAHDYRYFPEPDLPMLRIGTKKPKNQKTEEQINIDNIRAEIPELPRQRRERFAGEFALGAKEIEILAQDKDLGEYFEQAASELLEWMKDKKISEEKFPEVLRLCANYIITDLQALLKEKAMPARELLISPEDFAEFITLIYEGKITSKVAKDILREMFGRGTEPHRIIEEKNLEQMSDEGEIKKIVEQIIAENPGPAGDYKNGKLEALQFLVGKVMSATKGKANPKMAQEILRQNLENRK